MILGHSPMSSEFGLSGSAHGIITAIERALEKDMPELISEFHYEERLGYGQFRWNPIIRNLRENCVYLGMIEFGVCKRGAWKVPVLLHLPSKMLMTLMTEATFHQVQRSKTKGSHYLCGASSFNTDVIAQEEQLKFDLPFADIDEVWISETKRQLVTSVMSDIPDVAGHVLVLFDCKSDKLVSSRAVRLTKNLEISTETEDWSGFIGKPFDTTKKIMPQNSQADDDDDQLVELL